MCWGSWGFSRVQCEAWQSRRGVHHSGLVRPGLAVVTTPVPVLTTRLLLRVLQLSGYRPARVTCQGFLESWGRLETMGDQVWGQKGA